MSHCVEKGLEVSWLQHFYENHMTGAHILDSSYVNATNPGLGLVLHRLFRYNVLINVYLRLSCIQKWLVCRINNHPSN